MATFVLLHGAGSDSWYWHRVAPLLRDRGHDVVTPDLPITDDSAGLDEYADVVLDAIGERRELVLVAQSFAGFTAPLVCERVPVDLLIFVNAMVPAPGEPPGEWWVNTGWDGPRVETEKDAMRVFLHDVPLDVAKESAEHAHDQSGTPFEKPWPLDEWPDVPTRILLGRNDRFFPPNFMRRLTRERLDMTADEIDGGHLIALSRPEELTERLLVYLDSLR